MIFTNIKQITTKFVSFLHTSSHQGSSVDEKLPFESFLTEVEMAVTLDEGKWNF